jgi:microsomal dipeptidase-like Zn-dependent dipeptidase
MAEAAGLVATAAVLAPMIADLHAHYPMHLVPQERGSPIESITATSGRRRFRDVVRARLVGLASRFGNYPSFDSGPRVTVGSLEAGDARVALSVLYSFFDEVDLGEPYAAPPEAGYVEDLLMEIDVVEDDISSGHAGSAAVARSPAELEAALGAGMVALVHAVEGGFHLGATPGEVDAAVTRIAARGVAYVILAHLFFRQIATNAPALPFLPDRAYRLLFPQPDEGLTELGRAAVRAMVRERVLVDLSHMSERSLADTFALLDELDPGRHVPVLVSHAGYRFGKQEYMLSEESVRAVAARGGVIGLIFAQHQLLDGLPKVDAKSFEGSVEAFCAHVDRIAEITGDHSNIGIGSDFDGFIKPTLAGLETEADMGKLEAALRARYGDATAEAICCGNALRLLRGYWRGASAA